MPPSNPLSSWSGDFALPGPARVADLEPVGRGAIERVGSPADMAGARRRGAPRVRTVALLLGLAAAHFALGPASARATVGDDRGIELLGFEPRERKVFARSHGDPARECTVLVADLRRGRAASGTRGRSGASCGARPPSRSRSMA